LKPHPHTAWLRNLLAVISATAGEFRDLWSQAAEGPTRSGGRQATPDRGGRTV